MCPEPCAAAAPLGPEDGAAAGAGAAPAPASTPGAAPSLAAGAPPPSLLLLLVASPGGAAAAPAVLAPPVASAPSASPPLVTAPPALAAPPGPLPRPRGRPLFPAIVPSPGSNALLLGRARRPWIDVDQLDRNDLGVTCMWRGALNLRLELHTSGNRLRSVPRPGMTWCRRREARRGAPHPSPPQRGARRELRAGAAARCAPAAGRRALCWRSTDARLAAATLFASLATARQGRRVCLRSPGLRGAAGAAELSPPARPLARTPAERGAPPLPRRGGRPVRRGGEGPCADLLAAREARARGMQRNSGLHTPLHREEDHMQ